MMCPLEYVEQRLNGVHLATDSMPILPSMFGVGRKNVLRNCTAAELLPAGWELLDAVCGMEYKVEERIRRIYGVPPIVV